ncbi:MAG: inorganic pyrophosphatase [Solobacterium sp.]|nr:inorganic pyrophosphatase [Solobacterium sp.]
MKTEHITEYSQIIGQTVTCVIDRPAGSRHPNHPDLIYPINYGYVEGVRGGDGEWQDVYILGTDQPLTACTGSVIAVVHRLNDCEDKWIVSLDSKKPDREEILQAVMFQEQYFESELYL